MNFRILITIMLFGLSAQSQIIDFPDSNFKNALLNHYPTIDINGDNEIQVSEANSFTYPLYMGAKNINDLTGIEFFINTYSLLCYNNNLTSIDLSENINLQTINCSGNQLTNLNLAQSVNLSYLDCSNNNISSLDLMNTIINYFDCSYNSITSLQIPNSITELRCDNNNLISLDVSNQNNLKWLFCGENDDLTSININGCINLLQLNFSYTNISNLDFIGNNNLVSLEVPENEITDLDVSNLPNLMNLYCGGNQLSTLNIRNNQWLTKLGVSGNNLTELDVSNQEYLEMLWCHTNNIATLDLSNNSHLTDLYCSSDNLQNLNVQNGNNYNVTRFIAWQSPNLSCIYVDDSIYSQTNWTHVDPTAIFVETESECEALSITDSVLEDKLIVYPNPVSKNLYIDYLGNFKYVSIYNNLGQLILKTDEKTINFSKLQNGIYFIKVETNNGMILSKKIIKI